jgi:hypothetical protein
MEISLKHMESSLDLEYWSLIVGTARVPLKKWDFFNTVNTRKLSINDNNEKNSLF